MDNLIYSKKPIENKLDSQFSEKGLIIRDDDQDWGSAGMNDIKLDSDKTDQ